MALLAAAVFSLAWASGAPASVIVDTVAVGNPGNPDDVHTQHGLPFGGPFGGVDYTYNIGTFEVTAGQYAEFLNAVADDDIYGLYNTRMSECEFGCKIERHGTSGNHWYSVAPDWANRPVNYVSWGDAARFANWMHNGQPTGAQDLSTTEDGSYFLNGAKTDAHLQTITRGHDATWVIPSEDEWYKGAYHYNDGVTDKYYDYPTSSDSVPSNNLSDPDPGNNATFWDGRYTIGAPYYRTEVGAHENSGSPYGTFDQGGNVWEWLEASFGSSRGLRGGSFLPIGDFLYAGWEWRGQHPTDEWLDIGFRVAVIPEPTTMILLATGIVALLRRPGRQHY